MHQNLTKSKKNVRQRILQYTYVANMKTKEMCKMLEFSLTLSYKGLEAILD